ncbi:MAG: M48 family metallopeptidase [Acidobacteriota bacterium]|nr:M48 family metallopeptidase [Acidobacteriota bacterium]
MTDVSTKLLVDGMTLDLVVVRKRVKNINARLHGSTLAVSAPHRVSRGEVHEAAVELARRLLRRARADAVNGDDTGRIVAHKVATRFPKPPTVSEVRFSTNQFSQWGSYSSQTGIVRLNAVLKVMPPWVLEAVVAHELAHSVHPDHSPAFWELVRSVCRHTDRANAFLDGVRWLASSWDDLQPAERSQLAGKV